MLGCVDPTGTVHQPDHIFFPLRRRDRSRTSLVQVLLDVELAKIRWNARSEHRGVRAHINLIDILLELMLLQSLKLVERPALRYRGQALLLRRSRRRRGHRDGLGTVINLFQKGLVAFHDPVDRPITWIVGRLLIRLLDLTLLHINRRLALESVLLVFEEQAGYLRRGDPLH